MSYVTISKEHYEKLVHYADLEEQGRLIEQKRGYWIPNKRMSKSPHATNYRCSECMELNKRTPYCPNCGARMSYYKDETKAKLAELKGE